jgi:hypothetical protein
MSITRTKYGFQNGTFTYADSTKEQLYVGRVVRVENVTETRNWSDTLDYTDHRSTSCTYALVWLGTHGAPPRHVWGGTYISGKYRPLLDTSPYTAARDLAPHEQFAWVDCTNLFADRNGERFDAVADSFSDQLLWGGPEMLEALAAFDAHTAAEEAAREAKMKADAAAREAAIAVDRAKNEARAAKKAAKDAAGKAEAEKMLARIPAKGTTVTVDGITGKVFWIGASKYYGKWSARAGVKDSRGVAHWIPAEKF